MKTELIITSDGSHSLYVPSIDESYHSTHGAVQESMHIFIDNALLYSNRHEIRILEVGFGTGLNALLTYCAGIESDFTIHYTTIEKFPVDLTLVKQLNYSESCKVPDGKLAFTTMHKAEWNKWQAVSPGFELLKLNIDFVEFNPAADSFDVVYFDAFSPEKQPDLWTVEQFEKIYNACSVGAVLTTYCAKGVVRRALQSVGFKVERLPGPPGKREILRAVKI